MTFFALVAIAQLTQVQYQTILLIEQQTAPNLWGFGAAEVAIGYSENVSPVQLTLSLPDCFVTLSPLMIISQVSFCDFE